MSTASLVKALHQLTYKEMLEVAEHVSVALMRFEMKEKPGENVSGPPYGVVADILLGIAPDLRDSVIAQEEKILRELFRRKRTIAVELKGGGWMTDIITLRGAQAAGSDLRQTIGKTIDQIVTIQALNI